MERHAEESTPIYKKWWFWVIIVAVIVIIGSQGASNKNGESASASAENKVEVVAVDFSTMSREEVQAWCDTNKINCNIEEKYSDSIAKDGFVGQSVAADNKIYQGDKVTITYSLGKEPSKEYKNALKKAESYSNNLHMSKKGIYNQLTSQYGEKFPADAAQYAIDNIQADWNANALAKAKSYQDNLNMSKNAIYKQLISEYGEKFTKEEAQYAIDHLDD